MNPEFREDGVEALGTVLKIQKNIGILEKNVYNLCQKIEDEEEQERVYKEYILQCVSSIIQKMPLKTILSDLKKEKVGWNHRSFDTYRFEIKERQDFIENPFIVEEGVLQCGRCQSKKVFSYSKQTRSLDEPTSVFAIRPQPSLKK